MIKFIKNWLENRKMKIELKESRKKLVEISIGLNRSRRMINYKGFDRRTVNHELDLLIQEQRRNWKQGDDVSCFLPTAEEIDFGIEPPKIPSFEKVNRFELMDI